MAVRGYFCLSFNTFVLNPCIFGIDLFSCMFCFPNSDHVIFSREFAFSLFIIMYTAISREVVGKSARDNPDRYCGWFSVLQRNLKE